MIKKGFRLALCLLFISISTQCWAKEMGQKLFDGFIGETNPEWGEMILDGPPDESGRIRHIYIDLKGADIGGVRIDRITVEGYDVVLTSPDTWGTEEANVLSVLSTNAVAVIKEEDINSHLKSKEFGDDESWNNLHLDFSPGKVYAKGYYLADLKLFKLNILIEIDGTFKVVGGRQIWLDDYKLKVNRAKVPDGLTDRAMEKIQPILDLSRFIFPIKLSQVVLDDEKAVIESIRKPEGFEGLRFEYLKDLNGKVSPDYEPKE
ncbi:LmeA family phospholipid-binding protein [Dethiosulfovibrio salsuginis]|uniref:DUF2993 domain-containing protein n=1 Tax=Dethiosulfovibrio salsuginis TaxID=561720 RepID=A0A1X7JE41_9BACT|nr:DUF2993 domain-containing protein [Dethiosulfovibrio salsuginis]SMG26294.1 Protein of unknown function [Dethiosulfovibrio salsuginis]